LGGFNVAAGKLKSTDTTFWQSGTLATNSSGFSGLAGGSRMYDGTFDYITQSGYYWTSTLDVSFNYGWYYALHQSNTLQSGGYRNSFGFSVRCINNNQTGLYKIKDELNFSITPNPSNSIITVSLSSINRNSSISITNLTGNEVATYNLQNTSTKTIDVSNLAEGVYFVTLKSDEGGMLTKKIIKTN
jgi:hypothetical protein